MGTTLAAGRDAKIGIRPNVSGKLYGTGFLYLTGMSEGANLSFSAENQTQEVYGEDAKIVSGTDTGSFEATAFVTNTSGQVHKITVGTAGSGYTSAPTVGFSGGTPTTAATAIAEVDVATGTITGVFITNFGEGYASAPTISFTGGGGTGAAATAVIGGNSDQALYGALKNKDLKIEFSPNGGVASSKKTKFTFDFARESFSIEPAVNGVIPMQFSGGAQNVAVSEW